MANVVAIKFRAVVRRMLWHGFTNSNLPAAIDRGALRPSQVQVVRLVCRSRRQMFFRFARANSTQASTGGCDTSADQLARSGKVQICREQRSANETRRLGGEYPRATTALCQCEVATITQAAGILLIESKCCATGARLIALSGVVVAGALQQLN